MEFCDFLAEDELIEVIPNFKYEQVLNLINGDFGPFIPGIPTRVPLWMALNLFRQQKCKINLPKWVADLDELVREQLDSQTLIKMPSKHWREVLKLLQAHGVVIPHERLKDLVERREAILRRSVTTLLDNVVNLEEDRIAQVKIRNITKFELGTIKKYVAHNLAISKSIQKD